ncbi:hypothetical protein V1527DRAFT_475552 [Lipomyces starkeyi]
MWLVPDNRPLAAEQQVTEKGAGENPTSPPTPSNGSDNQDPPKDPPSRSALWRVAFLLCSPRLIVAPLGKLHHFTSPDIFRQCASTICGRQGGDPFHPFHEGVPWNGRGR